MNYFGIFTMLLCFGITIGVLSHCAGYDKACKKHQDALRMINHLQQQTRQDWMVD